MRRAIEKPERLQPAPESVGPYYRLRPPRRLNPTGANVETRGIRSILKPALPGGWMATLAWRKTRSVCDSLSHRRRRDG